MTPSKSEILPPRPTLWAALILALALSALWGGVLWSLMLAGIWRG